jgi:hypothetical protein
MGATGMGVHGAKYRAVENGHATAMPEAAIGDRVQEAVGDGDHGAEQPELRPRLPTVDLLRREAS